MIHENAMYKQHSPTENVSQRLLPRALYSFIVYYDNFKAIQYVK